MNTALHIGQTSAPTSSSAPRARVPETGGGDFGALIANVSGSDATARHLSTPAAKGAGLGPAAEPTAAETELSGLLAGLLEKLAALTEQLEEGEGLDPAQSEEIEAMLADIGALLSQGTPLPQPGTAAFAALDDMAAALGLDVTADPESATRPLDILSGLGAKLADGLREDEPELAAKLTEFSKALDTASAAIHTAIAEDRANAINPRQIESETRLNPAAAIAGAGNTEGDQVPDSAARAATEAAKADANADITSQRSLAKPEGGETGTRPDAAGERKSATATAAANAAAATAAGQPEPDAPDGLIVQAGAQTSVQSNPAGAARPEAVAYQRPDAQINMPFIAAEISRHVQNGINRFEIRMNPPELGRIDVRMEMDTSGNVVARLAVEKSETLDLLQRDQRTLERALADAGLDASKTELEFSLQQDGGHGGFERDTSPFRDHAPLALGTQPQSQGVQLDPGTSLRGYARLDAVNLWV